MKAVESSRPPSVEAVVPFVEATEKVLALLDDAECSSAATHELRQVLEKLSVADSASPWRELFDSTGALSSVVAGELRARGTSLQESVDAMQSARMAAALPAEPELRRLGRYLTMLQKGIDGQLRILGEVRRQAGRSKKGATGGSFGASPQQTFRLRVVR